MANLTLRATLPGLHGQHKGRPPVGWQLVLALALAIAAALTTYFIFQELTGSTKTTEPGPAVFNAALEQAVAEPVVVQPPAHAEQPALTAPVTAVNPATPNDVTAPAAPAVVAPLPAAPLVEAPAVQAQAQVTQPEVTTAVAAPKAITDIRAIDLTAISEIGGWARAIGGRIDTAAVVYVDLTGDGVGEALVPVTTDGTLGNLAYFVVTVQDNGPAVLLRLLNQAGARNGLRVTVEDGRLVQTSGVYGPADPLCCPGQIEKRYLKWDGDTFELERLELIATNTSKQPVN